MTNMRSAGTLAFGALAPETLATRTLAIGTLAFGTLAPETLATETLAIGVLPFEYWLQKHWQQEH